MLNLRKKLVTGAMILASGCLVAFTTPMLAQEEFPNFPVGTENPNIQTDGPAALVPSASSSLYPYSETLIYVYNGTLDSAYTTDGVHYTEGSYILYNGNYINVNCEADLSDICGVGAAVAPNGVLYVAYAQVGCKCLHVIAGTPVPGTMNYNWSYVYNETAYQLVSAPAVAIAPGGNVVIRFGTTSQNSAYSAVFNGSSWSLQADNGYAPTQGTLFVLNGKFYCIEKQNNGDNGVFWVQVNDYGVDMPGTGGQISGWYANSGFSTVIYNGDAVVASRVNNSSNDLQIWSSSDGVSWYGKTYTNNQTRFDFDIGNYNDGVAMAYACNCGTPVLFGNWAQ